MYTRIMEVDPWVIKSTTLDKTHKRLQESLTSLGNGYMGARGSFEERYSADSHLGTYIAGVWFPDKTRVGWWKNGYPKYFGKAINAVNFGKVAIFVDNQEVDLAENEVSGFSVALDMQTGVLRRTFTVFGVQFCLTKFFSVAQKELALMRWDVVSADGKSHHVKIESFIDADVKNEDANYEETFWQVLNKKAFAGGAHIAAQTVANPFGVPQFIVNAQQSFAGDFTETAHRQSDWQVSNTFEAEVGEAVKSFEKRVVVTTSRDYENLGAVEAAGRALIADMEQAGFADLLAAHENGWRQRWAIADVVIEGNDAAQQGIRFNLFQLFSTYYGEDARLNIGPKGFTGEKYGGATYWDTEAYAVPLYLSLAEPQVTENLLKYRHNQLPQAQHNAREQGLAGALYPMVTFTGIECHNEWEITFEEIHRNGAIAYAIYNYTNYTGDEGYLAGEGLEVLVEIARFWADRVHYSQRHGKYMIHGVTGPNEYENNINNNWYTNRLAVWVLRYTLESLEKYPERAEALGIIAAEKAKWQDIIDNMYFPYDEERQVFVQHDTFLDKDLKPVSALDKADLPLNQHWSWDKILRSCFIKQADVLQGIYLFGDEFTLEEKERNFDFYEPMTVHESSLSPCIHAILAAELHKEEKAVELYQRTARLDLDNYNNDTEDGLHITSMTGSWLTIAEGFAGMRAKDGLSFAPFLPKDWTHYQFHINYRGSLILIAVNKEHVSLTLVKGEALSVRIYDEELQLKDEIKVALKKTVSA